MPHVPNVIRPTSSIPNNAPTEQEILAGLASAGIGAPRPPIMRFPNIPPRLPLTPDLLQLIHSHPSNPSLLETREAKSLQFALAHGHAKPMQLVSEFAHREFDPHQREVLVAVLKLLQNQGRLPINMHQLHQQQQQQQQQQGHPMPHVIPHPQPTSPRSSPLFPDNVNLALLQQQQPQHGQQRLSPAMMMQLAAAQQAGRKPASLSVSPQPAGQQRIPSPQEISLHTQNIMQHALIKRKLEEQREKYRQRQEGDLAPSAHAGQHHVHQAAARIAASENIPHRSNSDAKQNSSPLTFTPTVVMKKFVSDRRDSDPRPQIPELKISQSGEMPENKGKHEAQSGLMSMPGQSAPHLSLNSFMSALQSGDVPRESHSGQQGGARGGSGGPPGADLSRFFSHDVLSRAGPAMPPVPIQEAMTLEEIERQASSMRT